MHPAVKKLVEYYPNTAKEIAEDSKIFGDEYPEREHSVYIQSFNPMLIELLSNPYNKNQIAYAFALIEDLAGLGDESENLVAANICEMINSNDDWVEIAQKYMGDKTKNLFEKAKNMN